VTKERLRTRHRSTRRPKSALGGIRNHKGAPACARREIGGHTRVRSTEHWAGSREGGLQGRSRDLEAGKSPSGVFVLTTL